MKKWLLRLGITAALLGVGWLCLPEPPPLMADIGYSTRVLDRDGRLLRLALSADDKYRLQTPLADVSPELIWATMLQEDQHFWQHFGVNPIAAVRAGFHAALGHGGRGGASTITMQLARLRYRLHTKSAGGKLLQIWRALEIERHYTKRQILENYLNVAPYGGNIEGIGAASLLYFNKSPARLTTDEAVLLSVLPQSPTSRAPRASPTRRSSPPPIGLPRAAPVGRSATRISATCASSPRRISSAACSPVPARRARSRRRSTAICSA
jgi:membrane carboxypeptidase/penicillin-binding protein PbpC